MDASTRAIPDLVFTMTHHEPGNSLCRARNLMLKPMSPPSPSIHPYQSFLAQPTTHNQPSSRLSTTSLVLGPVVLAGTHQQCADPVDFFLRQGSLKSACDCLRQAASSRCLEVFKLVLAVGKLNDGYIRSSPLPRLQPIHPIKAPKTKSSTHESEANTTTRTLPLLLKPITAL